MLNKVKKNRNMSLFMLWSFGMAGLFLFGVGGCSTCEGIGADIQSASRWVSGKDDND